MGKRFIWNDRKITWSGFIRSLRKGDKKLKEKQFTEDVCKVLVHEDSETVFALLNKAGIEIDVEKDNVFDVIRKIRGLKA